MAALLEACRTAKFDKHRAHHSVMLSDTVHDMPYVIFRTRSVPNVIPSPYVFPRRLEWPAIGVQPGGAGRLGLALEAAGVGLRVGGMLCRGRAWWVVMGEAEASPNRRLL